MRGFFTIINNEKTLKNDDKTKKNRILVRKYMSSQLFPNQIKVNTIFTHYLSLLFNDLI